MLRGVVAASAQRGQIPLVDVAGDVTSIETTRIKPTGVGTCHRGHLHQIFEGLVEQPVAPDVSVDVLDGTPVGDELGGVRHVNAVHVGVPDWRCC